MIGPIMSVGASAVTQLSSPAASVALGAIRAEEGSALIDSGSGALRLRDFFSPLKDKGLTMLYCTIHMLCMYVGRFVGKMIVVSFKHS